MQPLNDMLIPYHDELEARLTPDALKALLACGDLGRYLRLYQEQIPWVTEQFLQPGMPLHSEFMQRGVQSDAQMLTLFLNSFFLRMHLKYKPLS